MTDAIGSTESGMNGIRVVQKGDAPKEGITTVLASADTIVLDEDFAEVEAGSGNIPIGCYNDPVKSAEVFVTDKRGNRWSIPGDFATVEADGRITLLGRGSVSINSGGEKIFPEEVEGALKSHPDVFDTLVIGVPDERLGQAVAAVVQPRDGATLDPAELDAHVHRLLAGYKAPRRIWVAGQVGRSPSGKADYRWAKAYAEQHPPLEA